MLEYQTTMKQQLSVNQCNETPTQEASRWVIRSQLLSYSTRGGGF